jgi:dTDP-4-dehydrorhamnose 3,5-epimerase-like enzyme
LHFQQGEHAQGISKSITGKVLDIAVDIRPDSPTLVNGSFMSWMGRAIKWFIYQEDLLMA